MAFVDWSPIEHPRDHDGKFVKKGHGTFKALFGGGKQLTATVTKDKTTNKGLAPALLPKNPVADKPSAGGIEKVKVGGVFIQPPQGIVDTAATIDYALKKGEWVSKLYGVTDGLIHFHTDGSVTVLHPTDALEVPTHMDFHSLAAAATVLEKAYGPFGEWKISNPIDWFDLDNQEVNHYEVLNDLPIGAQISVEHSGNTAVFEKSAAGKWLSASSAFSHTAEQFKPAIAAGKVKFHEFDYGPTAKDQTFDLSDFAPSAQETTSPVGAAKKVEDDAKAAEEAAAAAAPKPLPGLKPGQKVYIAPKGNKNLFAIEENGKIVQLLNKSDGTADGIKKQQLYNWQFSLKKGTLVEATDLSDIPLDKLGTDDTSTPEEVAAPKPEPKFLAVAKPGEGIKVPGTNLTVQPGQQLYASKAHNAKGLYALVENGKVKALIDKETGVDPGVNKQQVYNWQFALKKGTLVPVFDATALPAAEAADTFLEKSAEAVAEGKAEEVHVPDAPDVPELHPLDANKELAALFNKMADVAVAEADKAAKGAAKDTVAPKSDTSTDTSQPATPLTPEPLKDWEKELMAGIADSIPEPAPKKKAAAKPKAAPKVKAKKNPNAWAEGLSTSPETYAGVVHLKPNQSVWQGDGFQFGLIDGKIPQVWNTEGVQQAMWEYPDLKGKKSAATLLKKGYVPIGSGLIVGEPEELNLPAAQDNWSADELRDKLIGTKSWGTYNSPLLGDMVRSEMYAQHGGEGEPYSVERFASDKVQNMIRQNLAEGIAARQAHGAELTTPEKSRLTKSMTVWTAAAHLGELSSKLLQGEMLTEVEQAHAITWWQTLYDNSKFHSNSLIHTKARFNDLLAQVKFADSVQGLDFNPTAGTDADYLKYLKSKNASNLAGFTPEMMKAWTLADLGAPNSGGDGTKGALETQAAHRMKLAALATHADAVLAKKKALAPPKAQVQQQTLETKVASTTLMKLSKLHSAYVNAANGATATYQGGDAWLFTGKAGVKLYLNTDETFTALMSADAEWQPAEHAFQMTDPITVNVGNLMKALGDDPVEWLDPYNFAQLEGAHGAHGMMVADEADVHTWLLSYLIGDAVGQYEVESRQYGNHSHHLVDTHPGSPQTTAGAAQRQELSNWLATQGWWKGTDPVPYTGDDVTAAAKALGLDKANAYLTNIGADQVSIVTVFKGWLGAHTDLPAPQTPQIHTGNVKVSYGHGDFEVSPGDAVLFNPKSDMFAHIYPGKVAYVNKIDSAAPVVTPIDDDVPHMAANLSALGFQDVTPVFAATSVPATFTDMPKPSDVSETAWKAALAAEESSDALVALIGPFATKDIYEIQSLIMDISPYSGQVHASGETKLKILNAPEPVQRLAAWAYQTQFGPVAERPMGTDVLRAVVTRAEGNQYVSPEPPVTFVVTKAQHGATHDITVTIPPGGKLYALSNQTFMVYFESDDGEQAFGYLIDSDGSIGSSVSSFTAKSYQKQGKLLAESLVKLNPAKAKLEGYQFSDGAWDALSTAEGQKKWSHDAAETTSAYLTKQALVQHGLTDQFPNLQLKMAMLPVGVKQFALQAALTGDTDKLTALTWKMGKGFYDTGVYQHSHLIVDMDAPYAGLIAKGLVTAEHATNWPHDAQMAFISDHAAGITDFFPHHPTLHELSIALPEDLGATIAQYIDHLNAKKEALTSPPKMGEVLKDTSNITLTYVKPKPGGAHSGAVYADQFGEEWLTKSFASDPNAKARVDAEHYANVIGRMFGFHQPVTFVRTMPDGNYSYVQHWDAAVGSLSGFSPTELSEDQLTGVMQEHVLDWLISNHDSHPDNLLRAPDGKTILGIDKGQAFVNYHRDKLAVGYKPPTNPIPVWYDDFYNAVLKHKIDQDLAERVAQKVLLKAYQTQSRNDARFKELLEAALEKRTNFPDKYPNAEALVEAAMARKAALLDDFTKLYQDIWKKAGWNWTIDPKSFTSKVGLAHTQNGPLFTEAVKQSGSVGTALMFSTPDLMDAHGMFTVMDQKDGGSTLLGTMKVTKDADAKLVTWLSGKVDPTTLKDSGKVAAVTPPSAQLPNIADLHSAVVAYAKTLSTHYTDGEYNASTISTAQEMAAKVRAQLVEVMNHRKSDPTLPLKGKGFQFMTLEQQDAWVAAAQRKLAEFDMAEDAHKQKKKLGDLYPNEVPFQPISYTPSKDLSEFGKAVPLEQWKTPDGTFLIKSKDGGHWEQDADGKGKQWMSASEYKALVDSGDLTKVDTDETSVGSYWESSTGAKYIQQEDGTWWEYSPAGTVTAKGFSDASITMSIEMSPDEWELHGPSDESKTVEVQIVGKQMKVTYAKAATHTGSVDFKTGKLLETKSGDETEFQTGTDYVVEYGNIKIRYRPHTGSGVAKSQKGLLQLQLKNWDGTPTSLDDALDTLQIMGLDVDPASRESLELTYWQQMTNVLRNRTEAKQAGKYKDVLDAVSMGLNNPGLSIDAEIAMYKNAWSKVVKDMTKVDFTPQFDTWFGQRQGHPWWRRPDMDEEDLKQVYKGTVPIHSVNTGDKLDRTLKVIQSGGLLSSEERVRVLGKLFGGMSSESDQGGTGNGSSVYVFTRQNTTPFAYTTEPYGFLVDPRAALKGSNYALPGDSFGNTAQAADSPFDKSMYKFAANNNELLVKDGVPIMYAVARTTSDRNTLLQNLQKLGITEVRGMPIEQFVILNSDVTQKMADIWDEIAAEEKQEVELAA